MLNFNEAQLTTSFFHGHIFIFTMRLVLPDLHILKFVCGMKVWGFFFSFETSDGDACLCPPRFRHAYVSYFSHGTMVCCFLGVRCWNKMNFSFFFLSQVQAVFPRMDATLAWVPEQERAWNRALKSVMDIVTLDH